MVANEWLAGHHADDQRRFTQLLWASLGAHVVLLLGLALAPSPAPPPLPEVLRVDLVAGLPAPPRAGPSKPAPAPAPAPVAKPRPKQVVLPKEAPRAVPKKRKTPPPPARPEPVEYEDAMAQLRNELGEQTPAPAAAPSGASEVSDEELMATTAPGQTGTGGSTLDKDTARWVIATQRHVRNSWVTPPEFLNRGLATIVEVELTALGGVVGTPRVVRPSGGPFFDDNAVRAVLHSAPLPAPPASGTWTFSFSED